MGLRRVGGATGEGRGRQLVGRGGAGGEVGECGRDALPLQEFGELAAVGGPRGAPWMFSFRPRYSTWCLTLGRGQPGVPCGGLTAPGLSGFMLGAV